MKNMCVILLLSSALHAAEVKEEKDVKDQWVMNWVKGIEYAKDYKTLSQALEVYGVVIEELQRLKLKEIQLNIINERGELYFKAFDFIGAVNDFTYVIDHPMKTKQQYFHALWGRSKALLAAGKFEEFEKDVVSLDQDDQFFSLMADTPNYLIVRLHLPFQDESKKEKYIKFLKMNHKISFDKSVTFTPSGLVILEK